MSVESPPSLRNWQAVQEEVLRRIHARIWKPGDLIPNEADLALEFGCARTTVNRALRSVAESGLLDRRRKAGTRVALQPVVRATLSIPILRHEIEARGHDYTYRLVSRQMLSAPDTVAATLRVAANSELLHLRALHLADSCPYVVEDRWINPAVVPDACEETFEHISGNEWLLINAPYTHGEIALSADAASRSEARELGCAAGDAVFVLDRLTCDHAAAITSVRLVFAPGHRVQMDL
ncbi:GntR family transcriptional regulator [Puniceibacterium sp. IMCC21224]|uniref:GntR family transcriptional regulator n=1 Tax=Puniceibacterium sp. IMCC21224 TaxID=1618204 RepID=UPI00065D9B16|nr:GntR family transcriptional regulator [Puniceibacterium sp. IMCC21224]KMK66834.1 transcriptional regulator, GntR family [Puniceibacterium sp. IMCC21224]